MKHKIVVVIMVIMVVGWGSIYGCAKKSKPVEISEPPVVEETKPDIVPNVSAEDELAEQRRVEEARLKAENEKQAAIDREKFLSEKVYFDFDSSTLDEKAKQVLRKKVAWLNQNPKVAVIIEGHCDERGSNEYNIALGDRRANSVKTFLVMAGVENQRLDTISYGEERPESDGHDETVWAKNRRAQFRL